MNTLMSQSRPKFGLQTLVASIAIFAVGATASAGGEPIAHSDVPDLPSAHPFLSGNDWTRPQGKTQIKLDDAPTWIGDVTGEDIDSENAPPPALMWTGPIDPVNGGTGSIPSGSAPSGVGNSVEFAPTTSSSIPAPGALVLFGLAAGVGARRRR